MIALENGCAYRRHAENWLVSGRRPDCILELGSYHAMLASVAAGAGIALVPRSVFELHNCKENLVIYPIGPVGQISTYLTDRRDYISSAFEVLSQIMKKIRVRVKLMDKMRTSKLFLFCHGPLTSSRYS